MTHYPTDNLDPRTVRTLDALRAALMRLIRQKAVEDITISELTETAGVNRSTFYLHYANIPEMIHEIDDDLFQQYQTFLAEYGRYQMTQGAHDYARQRAATQLLLTETFRFLKTHRAWAPLIFSESRHSHLLTRILEAGHALFMRDWQPHLLGLSEEASPDYFNFVVGGAMFVFQRWLREDAALSPEEMAHRITSYILPERKNE